MAEICVQYYVLQLINMIEHSGIMSFSWALIIQWDHVSQWLDRECVREPHTNTPNDFAILSIKYVLLICAVFSI